MIDDNLDILELYKMLLEMKGFLVECAQGGPEALKILRIKQAPNLIILDMCMSGMNGNEFLDCLEATNKKIINSVPIVIMSAMNEDALNKTPLNKTVGFIQKPTDIDEFINKVQYYIGSEFANSSQH